MRLWTIISLAAIWAVSMAAAETLATNANIVRWSKGEYAYRTITEQRVRGLEPWTLTVHPDGSRTMMSFVDNFDAGVQYNMILRVDAAFRPIESFLTHWVGGQLRASGYYVVDKDQLTSSVGLGGTRTDERVTVPAMFSLHTHPVATDGWRGAWYDRAKGGVQSGKNFNLAVAPTAPNPLHGKLEDEAVAWVGAEQITVPAGTFDVEHYKFRGTADIWITPKDRIVVRYATIDADREYVLTRFEQGGGE